MPGTSRWFARLCLLVAGLLGVAGSTVALAPPAAATVGTLYVGGAGCSDTGPGTETQPFCTISAGAAVAGAGQTVLVAGGTYAEQVTVGHSGSPGSPVVIRAAPGAAVTVTGGTNGFLVSSRQYVTINGFTVTDTVSYGISPKASGNIVLAGNTVAYAGFPASGRTATGINVNATSNSTITGNVTDHNSDSGIYLTNGSTGNVVSYNESSFNARQWQRNANGINVVAPGNTVTGNVLHDNEDSGLQFYPGGDNSVATLNVSYNNGDHGIDDLNVTGGRLIANTIYHNCTSGINVEGTSGSYVVENNVSVDNAVFLVNPTPINPPGAYTNTCNRRAGNIGIWDSAPPTTTVDSNLVNLTVPGTMYVFGSPYTSLAAMKAATAQEQHGIQADPRFAGAAGGDLRLTEGSPAIDSADSGAPFAAVQDATGAPRVDDPLVTDTGLGARTYDDRGAYEFQPSGGGPRPPVATLSVSPATGTAPLSVTADASGSTDPQGQPLTYTFAFGDGANVGPQAQPTAAHTYTAAGGYTVTVTVTDTSNLSSAASQAVTVSVPTGGGGTAAYVNQIATNYSTSVHTSGSITVWRTQGVAAGSLIVLTLQLTGTAPTGTVTGTDDAGDTLAVARDVADGSGDRLVLLYGVAHTGLVPNSRISVTFPTAATYRLAGDEVSGVSVLDQQAAAAGSGGAYASGATGATSAGGEFVFGAVGLFAGTAPVWAAPWNATANYAVGSNWLGRAWQVPATTGSFDASGTGSGGWLAICVTFR